MDYTNFKGEIEDLSLNEITSLAKRMLYICNISKLTPDQQHWAFWSMCVKAKDGKWYDLTYGQNYYIKIVYNRIFIVPSKHLYLRGKNWPPTEFDDEYEINSADVAFPQHTGWAKVLNKK